MPGCAAIGCNNRSEKGFTMKCFPRNWKLRKIWTERVSRADWEPSNNSFLCHVHFEADQWTVTQSGRIKLKKNAIPSIFTVTSTRKSPRKRRKLANGEEEDLYIIEYLDDPSNRNPSPTLRNTIYNSYTTSNVSTRIDRADYRRRANIAMEKRRNHETIVVSDETSETSVKETKRTNGMREEHRRSTYKTDSTGGTRIKTEEKPRMDSDDRELDEIEEKLRSICDGEPQSDDKSTTERRDTRNSKKINDKDTSRMGSGEEKSASKFPSSGKKENSAKQSQENIAASGDATDGKRRSRLKRTEDSTKRLVASNGTAGLEENEEKLGKEATNATKVSTFTIKLTGMDEDVNEIVEGLGTEPIFKYKSDNELSRGYRNLVTSVISVTDGCVVKVENDEEEDKRAKKLKRSTSSVDVKKETSPTRVTNGREVNHEGSVKLSVESPEENEDTMDRRELRKKIRFQEDVIRKLTIQLNVLKEPPIATNHVNTRSQSKRQQKIAPKTCNGEGRNDSKDQLLNEFSLKIKDSNESIKRLNKSINEEKQNVKNAQFQIRQRDNRIKELNWKLNKASKYIERAEKNANNYRKKMIGLQNLLTKKNAELENLEASRIAKSMEKSIDPGTESTDVVRMETCEDNEPDTSNESVVYRTVQDIFEESNHCDDDPIIDNPEDFMRQFAGSL